MFPLPTPSNSGETNSKSDAKGNNKENNFKINCTANRIGPGSIGISISVNITHQLSIAAPITKPTRAPVAVTTMPIANPNASPSPYAFNENTDAAIVNWLAQYDPLALPPSLAEAFRLGPIQSSLGITKPIVWLANLSCDFKRAYTTVDDPHNVLGPTLGGRRRDDGKRTFPRTFSREEQDRFDKLQDMYHNQRWHNLLSLGFEPATAATMVGAIRDPDQKLFSPPPLFALSPRMIVTDEAKRVSMAHVLANYLDSKAEEAERELLDDLDREVEMNKKAQRKKEKNKVKQAKKKKRLQQKAKEESQNHDVKPHLPRNQSSDQSWGQMSPKHTNNKEEPQQEQKQNELATAEERTNQNVEQNQPLSQNPRQQLPNENRKSSTPKDPNPNRTNDPDQLGGTIKLKEATTSHLQHLADSDREVIKNAGLAPLGEYLGEGLASSMGKSHPESSGDSFALSLSENINKKPASNKPTDSLGCRQEDHDRSDAQIENSFDRGALSSNKNEESNFSRKLTVEVSEKKKLAACEKPCDEAERAKMAKNIPFNANDTESDNRSLPSLSKITKDSTLTSFETSKISTHRTRDYNDVDESYNCDVSNETGLCISVNSVSGAQDQTGSNSSVLRNNDLTNEQTSEPLERPNQTQPEQQIEKTLLLAKHMLQVDQLQKTAKGEAAQGYAWCCDFCKKATFPTFSEAALHELHCARRVEDNAQSQHYAQGYKIKQVKCASNDRDGPKGKTCVSGAAANRNEKERKNNSSREIHDLPAFRKGEDATEGAKDSTDSLMNTTLDDDTGRSEDKGVNNELNNSNAENRDSTAELSSCYERPEVKQQGQCDLVKVQHERFCEEKSNSNLSHQQSLLINDTSTYDEDISKQSTFVDRVGSLMIHPFQNQTNGEPFTHKEESCEGQTQSKSKFGNGTNFANETPPPEFDHGMNATQPKTFINDVNRREVVSLDVGLQHGVGTTQSRIASKNAEQFNCEMHLENPQKYIPSPGLHSLDHFSVDRSTPVKSEERKTFKSFQKSEDRKNAGKCIKGYQTANIHDKNNNDGRNLNDAKKSKVLQLCNPQQAKNMENERNPLSPVPPVIRAKVPEKDRKGTTAPEKRNTSVNVTESERPPIGYDINEKGTCNYAWPASRTDQAYLVNAIDLIPKCQEIDKRSSLTGERTTSLPQGPNTDDSPIVNDSGATKPENTLSSTVVKLTSAPSPSLSIIPTQASAIVPMISVRPNKPKLVSDYSTSFQSATPATDPTISHNFSHTPLTVSIQPSALTSENETLRRNLTIEKQKSIEAVQRVQLKSYIAETARDAAEERASWLETVLVEAITETVCKEVIRREMREVVATVAYTSSVGPIGHPQTQCIRHYEPTNQYQPLSQTAPHYHTYPHSSPMPSIVMPSTTKFMNSSDVTPSHYLPQQTQQLISQNTHQQHHSQAQHGQSQHLRTQGQIFYSHTHHSVCKEQTQLKSTEEDQQQPLSEWLPEDLALNLNSCSSQSWLEQPHHLALTTPSQNRTSNLDLSCHQQRHSHHQASSALAQQQQHLQAPWARDAGSNLVTRREGVLSRLRRGAGAVG